MFLRKIKAFTMIELLVVVLILGILASIAVGVYTAQVERARIAAAKSTIAAMEVAINRYEIDLGVFPPSLSGPNIPATWASSGFTATGTWGGCGWLELALLHSMSGDFRRPASRSWQGPYMTIKRELLGDVFGNPIDELAAPPPPGQVQILDPWHAPYRYVRSGPDPDSYDFMFGTQLPQSHPYRRTETYYNPSTFQIVSSGPDGITPEPPAAGLGPDDVTNFGL